MKMGSKGERNDKFSFAVDKAGENEGEHSVEN